jgi:3-dehydroquinate synthase
VFDQNTWRLFGPALEGTSGVEDRCVLPGGEEAKRWESVLGIASRAVDAGLGRDGWFLAVGGGAVCDVTAFAASVYMRGAMLHLVPTTLLAMVDASLGGKTGVDFAGLKNMLGSFYPAHRVDLPLDALCSLPEGEYRSGLGEVLKTALLGDAELYRLLAVRSEAVLSRDRATMADVVARCLGVKAAIVARDPRESGDRAFLNLGHTFAHALESVAGLGTIRHGEAVAWGLGRAMELGARLALTPPRYRDEVMDLLSRYGFATGGAAQLLAGRPEAQAHAADRLLEVMRGDKKKRSGRIRFVLQRAHADTVVSSEVPEHALRAVLEG